MISSSGDSRRRRRRTLARRSSTPASAIVSRTRTFIRRDDVRFERLERARDRDAALDLRAELGQRQLDRGERGRDVEDVEPADVADPEDLALQVRLPRRERDAVPVAQMREQLVAVDALRRADRRHDGGGVVVGREELEPHRLDARARGAAEPDVALERCVEPVVEQQAERDVEAADQRHRRRERGVELVLRLLVRAPVEVEAAGRLRPREHVLRDRDDREPGRAHQRLLRAGDDDVDPPRVRLERHGAERRDRVDDERRVADRLLDRAHVGDDAGRGVGLLAEHELDARLAHGGADLVGVGHLAPLVADRLHVDARAARRSRPSARRTSRG